MKIGRLLASGYVVLDAISCDGEVTHRAGGTAANVAANLAFLGWRSAVAGMIGADAAGRCVRSDLQRSGVNASALVARADASTPVIVQTLTARGHRFLFSCPECGTKAARYRAPEREAAAAVHTRMLGQVFFFDRANGFTLDLAARAKSRRALVMFEPSTLGRASDFDAAIALADVVKASEQRLVGFRDALRGSPQGQVHIVTRGARGASLRARGRWQALPSYPAKVVDAAGAGDWTTAGFLFALQGATSLEDPIELAEALKFGQALAAESCGFIGARGMSECCDRDQVLDAVRVALAGGMCPRQERASGKFGRSELRGCGVCLREDAR